MDFLTNIEKVCPGQITTVDIGGGLSTSYTESTEPEEFQYIQYRRKLEEKVSLVSQMNKYTESAEPKEFQYIQYRRKLKEKVSFIDE